MRNRLIPGRRIILFLLLSIIVSSKGIAHGSWKEHAKDIMAVFGLEYDGRKARANMPIKEEWIQFISSDMIDNTDFHKRLSEKHKGFPNLGNGHSHRILFHWAFDAEPWNEDIERIVKEYCEVQDLNVESNIRIFKSELKSEQKRRNGKINRRTGHIFNLVDGGKQGKIINFLSSMAYNVHILGDYMSDNTVLTGLNELNDLMGKIIISLRDIDLKGSKIAIKEINAALRLPIDNQKKADKLMAILIMHVPTILKNAQEGLIYSRLKNKGYKFKDD